ncbi:MAG: glycosyltransferase family 39 protein [Anaerolineae bacterium]
MVTHPASGTVTEAWKPFYRSWGGVLALLCAAAFLILSISSQYLHSDEELSYRATNGTLIDTIRWQTSLQDNQAPLWFVTFNLWRTFTGSHEVTARMGMILIVLPALALVYQIARRGFKSRTAGALSVLVLVGNHLFFNYAHDIRPYPLVMLVSTFSIWALQTWLMHGRRRDALIYGVSLALLLYTHYLLVFFVAAQAIFVLLAYRLTRQRIVQAVQAAILAVLLWLPWIPIFLSHMALLRSLSSSTGDTRGAAGITVSTQPTTLENIGKLIGAATNGQWALYALILLIGMLFLWRRRAYWLALTWGLLTPALYLLVNLVAATYAPRYISFALLGLGMAVGSTLAFLPRIRQRTLLAAYNCRRRFGLALNVYTFPTQVSIPPREPYRDVFRAMNTAALPGDVVLMVHGGEGDPLVDFDARLYLDPALIAATTTDVSAASASRRVWIVTRDWFGEGIQETFHQIEATHPLQQVIGQCDRAWCILAQLLEAPPNDHPVVFGDQLPFYGADVEVEEQSAVTVRLWWRIEDQPPSADYSFSVQLIQLETGQLITQVDGPLHPAGGDVVPTSAMQPGQIYIDERELVIAPPTADQTPVIYVLNLVVYDPISGTRLLLPNGDDQLELSRWSVGTSE